MAAPQKQYPKDALVIIAMMKEMGITEYEPRVVTQLLEFATRYVSCILDDSRAFANHSKKKSIDIEDVKLAVMMQLDRVFSTPPPRDLLLEVARTKNNVPLPVVKPHCGIRLPPDRYCFSSCNYKLKSNTSKKGAGSSAGKGFHFSGNQSTSLKISKTTQPISVVKRPTNLTTIAHTQSISATNPVIKFTTSSGPKLQAKPKIQVMGPGMTQMEVVSTAIRIEPEDGGLKRKRDEDDSDQLSGRQ